MNQKPSTTKNNGRKRIDPRAWLRCPLQPCPTNHYAVARSAIVRHLQSGVHMCKEQDITDIQNGVKLPGWWANEAVKKCSKAADRDEGNDGEEDEDEQPDPYGLRTGPNGEVLPTAVSPVDDLNRLERARSESMRLPGLLDIDLDPRDVADYRVCFVYACMGNHHNADFYRTMFPTHPAFIESRPVGEEYASLLRVFEVHFQYAVENPQARNTFIRHPAFLNDPELPRDPRFAEQGLQNQQRCQDLQQQQRGNSSQHQSFGAGSSGASQQRQDSSIQPGSRIPLPSHPIPGLPVREESSVRNQPLAVDFLVHVQQHHRVEPSL